jgi:hypothetical protein
MKAVFQVFSKPKHGTIFFKILIFTQNLDNIRVTRFIIDMFYCYSCASRNVAVRRLLILVEGFKFDSEKPEHVLEYPIAFICIHTLVLRDLLPSPLSHLDIIFSSRVDQD